MECRHHPWLCLPTGAALGGVLTMLAGVLMAHTVELDGAAGKSQDAAKDAAVEEHGVLAALLLGESAAPTCRLSIETQHMTGSCGCAHRRKLVGRQYLDCSGSCSHCRSAGVSSCIDEAKGSKAEECVVNIPEALPIPV